MKLTNLSQESKLYVQGFKHVVDKLPEGYEAVRELFNSTKTIRSKEDVGQLEKIEERFIPVDEETNIKVRIYTPIKDGLLPILVYFHGGGWVLGDLDACDATCRMISESTGIIVVSVDYRISPEYKYPTPLNDCYEAVKWCSENASKINGDASKIIVGGDSAGGNMATAAALMARDQGGPDISAQILVYPNTSFNTDSESYRKFENGFGLTKELTLWFAEHYVRNEKDKVDKYAAPLLAEDLSNLPPALVIVAENDVLRDGALDYANRLKREGVKVEYIRKKELVHGFFTNITLFENDIKETVSEIKKFLDQEVVDTKDIS